MSTIAKNEITVRSLRDLDAMVAKHVMSIKPPTRPSVTFTPARYTTWAGVEAVIKRLEERNLLWDISSRYPGQSDAYYGEVFMGKTFHSRYARSAPIALCLAALESVGCRVRLEMELG